MATVRQSFAPEAAHFLATAFPQYVKTNGTNFPVTGLAFDASSIETAYWKWTALGYGSGNITCDIEWYADTASSGTVTWDVSVAAITPDTDTQDVETKAFATVNSVTDTHLGTTGQRLHLAVVTISNLDSIAANDAVWLKMSRNTSDSMTGDAIYTGHRLSYSDT
jgi:hypothetical protein